MEWFKKFFDRDFYNRIWISDCGLEERTEKEVDFIISALGIRMNHRILDIPCGFGRHSIVLAKRGYNITGMDYNQSQIDQARERMSAEGTVFPILQGDMRNIDQDSGFDRIFNFFTSFGYFDREGEIQTVNSFHKALKPGGQVLTDIMNGIFIYRNHQTDRVRRCEEGIIIEESILDFSKGINNISATFIGNNGERYQRSLSLRIYTPAELVNLFEDNGFKVVKIFGDWDNPLNINSKRVSIIAEKR